MLFCISFLLFINRYIPILLQRYKFFDKTRRYIYFLRKNTRKLAKYPREITKKRSKLISLPRSVYVNYPLTICGRGVGDGLHAPYLRVGRVAYAPALPSPPVLEGVPCAKGATC